MDLSSGALWGAFGAIIFADILLSDDNAGEMFAADPSVSNGFHANMPEADFIFGAGSAVLVVAAGMWLQRRGRAESTA